MEKMKYCLSLFAFTLLNLAIFAQSNTINIEFVYDEAITDFASLDEEILEAIEYGNEAFKNSNIPFELKWINRSHRIRYDFSNYKVTTGVDDLFNHLKSSNHHLAHTSKAWLGNSQPVPNRVVVMIIGGIPNNGMGRVIDIKTNMNDLKHPFVWVSSDINGIGKWLLVHEIAHLFGATHCASAGGENRKFPACNEGRYTLRTEQRTIMSKDFENTQGLIPYFSESRKIRYGVFNQKEMSIGNASHNNAQTLRTNIAAWFAIQRSFPENFQGIAATSWQQDHYGVYAYRSDKRFIKNMRWEKFQWSSSQSFQTSVVTTDIAAVSWRENLYGIYALGSDGKLYQKWWNSQNWSNYGSLGKPSNTRLHAVSAVSWRKDNYGIYALGEDGKLYQKWYNSNNWSGFESLGRPSNTKLKAVSAVSWRTNNYGIYALGEDGKLYQKYWNSNNWSAFESLGRPSNTTLKAVSAVSWRTNNYGIYALGEDGKLYQKWYNSNNWSGFESLGRPSNTKLKAVSAVKWKDNEYGIYAIGEDGNLYQNWWNSNNWSGWERRDML